MGKFFHGGFTSVRNSIEQGGYFASYFFSEMVDPLTDFLWEHCPYLHEKHTKELLSELIAKHLEYKTIVAQYDEKGLVGVCRFNVDEMEANIFDVAIRPDLRKKDVLQRLLLQGLALYPNVKQLRFHSIDKNKEFVSPVSLILAKEK